jgi:DTW domain-containing protein
LSAPSQDPIADVPKAAKLPPDACPRCWKAKRSCVCDAIVAQKPKRRVLLLQHPQEPDVVLGTARIANLVLTNSVLRIGLSWPNLRAALGEDAVPSRWTVLYLGAVGGPSGFVDKKGQKLLVDPDDIDGVIVLDGTWSQAKALWWRNAWLTKCRRLVLAPKRPSRYGARRREPRREALSTLESVGLALTTLGEDPAIEGALVTAFEALLSRS